MFLAWPIDVERCLSSNPCWLHSGKKKAVVAGNRTQSTAFFLPEFNQPGLEDKYLSATICLEKFKFEILVPKLYVQR